VMVSRQNWFLSNIGLPGFWPHAELYVGTPADLKTAFDSDAAVQAWTTSQPEKCANFSELLARRYPEKWKTFQTGIDLQGHAPIRVVESISEGVSFTAVEHAFGADYFGAIRPLCSQLEKAKAIERAFGFQGRPYDFEFDFDSDATLVCTELVYKSYLPSSEMKGLSMTLVDVAGRRTLPANDIIRQFDESCEMPNPQWQFVLFFDASEKTNQAFESDEAQFRKTWKRVKWDVALK